MLFTSIKDYISASTKDLTWRDHVEVKVGDEIEMTCVDDDANIEGFTLIGHSYEEAKEYAEKTLEKKINPYFNRVGKRVVLAKRCKMTTGQDRLAGYGGEWGHVPHTEKSGIYHNFTESGAPVYGTPKRRDVVKKQPLISGI